MNDTRTKILDVAEDLIQKVGCNAMSYKHISDSVGIRKASIHHHFPKKENLINDLLKRCHTSYGDNYRKIVEKSNDAPTKLRQLAGVFENGLQKNHLCIVGTMSSDLNTLQQNSCDILEATIQNTVSIFKIAFSQGRTEGTLLIDGTDEDMAYAFFSFLVGLQISARVYGGAELFHHGVEAFISSWEKKD